MRRRDEQNGEISQDRVKPRDAPLVEPWRDAPFTSAHAIPSIDNL